MLTGYEIHNRINEKNIQAYCPTIIILDDIMWVNIKHILNDMTRVTKLMQIYELQL